MCVAGVAVKEENVSLADSTREEDGCGGVQDSARGSEGVVCQNHFTLSASESDGTCTLRDCERPLRGGDGKLERNLIAICQFCVSIDCAMA